MTKRPETWLMAAYYCGSCALAILTVWGDPAPTLVGALGRGPALWGLATIYATGGVSGLVGRFAGRRPLEVMAVKLLVLATVIHAFTLMVDGAITSGCRLLIAPLIMLSYAWRLETTLTRSDFVEAVSDDRHS